MTDAVYTAGCYREDEKFSAKPIAEQDEKTFKWPWMQTFTSKAFIPREPSIDMIDPLDICVALAREPRYNGHTKQRHAYSVGQHSVLMTGFVEPRLKPWALMHDAAEAYVKDLTWSVKTMLPEYKAIENGIEPIIAERFGLQWPRPVEIKHADNRMLATEAREVMMAPPRPWQEMPEPYDTTIQCWHPEQTMCAWAIEFDALIGQHCGEKSLYERVRRQLATWTVEHLRSRNR